MIDSSHSYKLQKSQVIYRSSVDRILRVSLKGFLLNLSFFIQQMLWSVFGGKSGAVDPTSTNSKEF